MHFQYFLCNFQRMDSYTSGHPVWPLATICVFARLRVVEKGADTFMSAPVFHILNIINFIVAVAKVVRCALVKLESL